ncbi:MAG TPA: hypothetical protein PLP61_12415, partial [Nocardioides sp.]|uniref:hypothetical protein n=1 Tax=Nocardioides sp. TaxID=35761 RepID=UPI002C0A0854
MTSLDEGVVPTGAADGTGRPAALPRTERPDAPAYLQRHRPRGDGRTAPGDEPGGGADDTPPSLRRFPERQGGG